MLLGGLNGRSGQRAWAKPHLEAVERGLDHLKMDEIQLEFILSRERSHSFSTPERKKIVKSKEDRARGC